MATTAPQQTIGDLRRSDLFFKLAQIIGEIKSIPKSGYNDFHKYDYVTANDLINAVRDKLAAAGIFIFTSVEAQEVREIVDKEKKSNLTLVTLKHTFACAESGETFSVLSQGQGADVSDKGGYKAITGAMKYFIYKCFLIPTDEDGSEIETTLPKREQQQPQRRTDDTRGGGEQERGRAAAAPAPTGSLVWREVAIHFGVYKGQKLGSLTPQQLKAWFNWKPNPRYKKAEDELLLVALRDAADEVNS